MKKLFAVALLGMVSFALIGTPAQASQFSSKSQMVLAKHKHHKHHHHHKK